MPFTPAHVAAVLPVVGRHRPSWAVPAALVVGSMVPDVLYFVPLGDNRALSHSLRGVVTLDLLLGVVSVALWWVVAAPVARDVAPRWVRARVPRTARPGAGALAWTVPCLVLGALTHLGWDAFTHVNGWAVLRWPVLTDEVVLGLPAYKMAQYGSGVVGIVVVAWWGLRQLGGAPPVQPTASPLADGERGAVWILLVLVPAVAGLGLALEARAPGVTVEMLLYLAVVRGLSTFGLLATGVALWWHAWAARRPLADGSPADDRHESARV